MAEIKRTDAIAGAIVHEYDGIEEADNALPTWWVVVFVGSLVFAALYWLIVEEFHLEPTPAEALALVQEERAKRTGVIGEQVSHHTRGDAEKVSTIAQCRCR